MGYFIKGKKYYKFFIFIKNGKDSGEFICPKYRKNALTNYLKYQYRKNIWMFYKKDKGWKYKVNIYHDHDDNEFFT